MDLLLHNPIADMYGPQFLLFYGCVIAITLFVCWLLIQDPTKNQPLRLIPTAPDPYEIAYLRSQATGVAHVALLNLIVQGYLEVSQNSISQPASKPDINGLQPLERKVLYKFFLPSTANTALYLATQTVQEYCHVYEEQLHSAELLSSPQQEQWRIKVGLVGAMIILSLGGYKLLMALGKGRYNVGFLITMAVISIIWLLWLASRRSRVSYRGYKYLQQLEEAFAPLKSKSQNFGVCSPLEYNLLIALFGMNALAGTTYNSYYQAFFPPMTSSTTKTTRTTSSSNSSSGSSCSSSSCSSSSCSSSSCGSSCGGGGGCGGCGG